VHDKPDEMALRVGDDVTFTALDLSTTLSLSLLPASNPRGPPLSVVFTDWLSITPALGLGSRPSTFARRHYEQVIDRNKPDQKGIFAND
jgi:hypothetical protein